MGESDNTKIGDIILYSVLNSLKPGWLKKRIYEKMSNAEMTHKDMFDKSGVWPANVFRGKEDYKLGISVVKMARAVGLEDDQIRFGLLSECLRKINILMESDGKVYSQGMLKDPQKPQKKKRGRPRKKNTDASKSE